MNLSRLGLFGSAFLLMCALVLAQDARAYPWMIQHGYTNCAACHVDPSGAGQLTTYGRGMADLVVRWHADPKETESGEPSSTAGFLFGLVPLPGDAFDVSGNLRGGLIVNAAQLGTSADPAVAVFPPLMALDLRAATHLGPFIANVSAGYGLRNVGPAVVVSQDEGPNNALVSREHWFGFKFLDDALVIRAGRIPLPFGLRNNEHTSFVRDATRTDGNLDQQHGVAVAFANDSVRTEVMVIAGNYQLRPDAVRERGYSGFIEATPAPRTTLGASSLLTYAERDIDYGTARLRQAHGFFMRTAPTEWLAFLGEIDGLVDFDPNANRSLLGAAAWLQADVVPLQGLHVMPTFEMHTRTDNGLDLPTLGGWASVAWYALPHTELRLDFIYRQTFPVGGEPAGSLASVLQVHLFL